MPNDEKWVPLTPEKINALKPGDPGAGSLYLIGPRSGIPLKPPIKNKVASSQKTWK